MIPALLRRPPPPVLVNVEHYRGCNLRCSMCVVGLTSTAGEHRSIERGLLDHIGREVLGDAELLTLSAAGEPLLDPRLDRILALADGSRTRLHLVTNGTRLPPTLDRLLALTDVFLFTVSAVDEVTFGPIRGGARLGQVTANIQQVVRRAARLSHPPRLGISTVVDRRNLSQLVPLVELTHELGLERLGVSHLTVFHRGMDSLSLRGDPRRVAATFADATRRARQLRVTLTLPPDLDGRPPPAPTLGEHLRHLARAARHGDRRRAFRLYRRRLRQARWARRSGGRVPCDYLMNRTYIGIDGDVAPCCMPGRPVAGSLREAPFDEIWGGPVLSAMRRGFLEGRPFDCCAHCSVNTTHGYRPADPATERPPSQQLVDPPPLGGGAPSGR